MKATWRDAVLCTLLDIGGSNCHPVELQEMWPHFQLGKIRVQEELHEKSYGQPNYRHWVRSIIAKLKEDSLIENRGRGIYALTQKGREEATHIYKQLKQQDKT